MSIKSNTDGLKKLAQNAGQLSNVDSIQFRELMSADFLANCSSFVSFEDFIAASGFGIKTEEDFRAVPSEAWEQFIVEKTSFDSWVDMQKGAMTAYVKAQLTKGI